MENTGCIPSHTGNSFANAGSRSPRGSKHCASSANNNQTAATSSKPGVTEAMAGKAPLSVLQEVQKAYEDRLQVIDRVGGPRKLEMTVEVLRSWVSDLVGQNALLAQVVEELEAEATERLMRERSKHQETEEELRVEVSVLKRRLAKKDSDLRGLIEVLRRLREFDYCTLDGIHFFEVTENDIFGTVAWRQNKLEQGDSRRSFWKQTKESIDKHNKFF